MKFWLKFLHEKWIKRNCPHFCIMCKHRKICIAENRETFKEKTPS